jgi:TseV toxin immunity protein TsiV
MVEKIDWSKFVLEAEGASAIVPCVGFVLFLDQTNEAGILDFYNRSMEALGGLLTHYKTGSMANRATLNARARAMVPTWLEDPRAGKDYFIQFSGCGESGGVTPASLELTIRPRPPSSQTEQQKTAQRSVWKKLYESRGLRHSVLVTILRVTFPADHPLAQPDPFLKWILALELVKSWPFVSGYAGYALNYYKEAASSAIAAPMRSQLASLCLRYPGLDWHAPGLVASKLLPYDPDLGDLLPLIKRVNWLTLVCDKSLARLGGRDGVQRQLADDAEIAGHALQHGLLIRAGDAPQLGNAAARDFIPAYGRVAKVVRPARIDTIDWLGTAFTEETVNEWLNAFDAGYE